MPCHLLLPLRAAARSAGSRLRWNLGHRNRNPDLTRSIAFPALLLCASAATASVLPVQPALAQPQLVQVQSAPTSGAPNTGVFLQGDAPSNGQTCTFTINQPIATGDTVVGFIHIMNAQDNTYMAPQAVTDNKGAIYTLAAPVDWLPWQEGINIFYLTNVQGNPTSFTLDFTNYPASGGTVLGGCNVGIAEYSGAGNVVVAVPTQLSGPAPSITVSPTSPALIWLFTADWYSDNNATVDQNTSLLQNSGFRVITDNWHTENIVVWSSNNLIQTSPITLTLNAPGADSCAAGAGSGISRFIRLPMFGRFHGCPTVLAAVALQSSNGFRSPPLPSPSPPPSPFPPFPTSPQPFAATLPGFP